MAFKRISTGTNGAEIWLSDGVTPNGNLAAGGLGALCIVQVPGSVALWQYTVAPNTWVCMNLLLAGLPLSSVTKMIANSAIDNTLFALSWAWATATIQTLFSLIANAITTGTVLAITTTSAAVNSTLGLFRVANLSATVTGILVRLQSNSTAGSGLTVLANGNTGLGTETPGATLHNAGSTVLGDVAIGNKGTGGDIGTAATTVDVASGATVAQTTAGQTLSLPAPTVTTRGRRFVVANVGSQPFAILTVVALAPGTAMEAYWIGGAWVELT